MPLVEEQYLPYLKEYDLDLEEKIEFIRAMYTFVEMLLDTEESKGRSHHPSGGRTS